MNVMAGTKLTSFPHYDGLLMTSRNLLIVLLAGVLWLPASVVIGQSETSPSNPPGVTIHVVQRGETLFAIAQSFGLTIDEVARYNGITNPASIQVGQRLLIPINVPAGLPIPQVHVVQPGETLNGIATLYGVDAEMLAVNNAINDPNSLYVGQTLTIGEGELDAVSTEAAEILTDSGIRHTIAAGETLFGIANSYDVTLDDLQQINAIVDPETIFAGQALVIPGETLPQTALNLPAPLISLDIYPLMLMTGQTTRIRMTASAPVTITASFLGGAVPVIVDQGIYLLFISVPLATQAGIYPFDFYITPEGGESALFSVNVQVEVGQYGTQYITLPPDRVELLAPAVEENELNLLHGVTSGFSAERLFNGPMGLPAAAVMNSPFGVSRSYNGGPVDRYHNGADFAGAPGSPVLAGAAGRVVLADTLNIRGTTLVLDHGWGVYTVYAHMSDRFVQLGDFVSGGQQIGSVGSTGRATGAHLHWELWVNGIPVDPMQWVREAFP